MTAHFKDDLGLTPDDSVFLHSGVRGLGLLKGGIETLHAAFANTISNGILMLPTFSYSWCNGEAYDPLTTDCRQMGVFGRDVWKRDDYVRSTNPNFSVAATSFSGDKRDIEDLYKVDNTCFGEASVFGNIYRRSLKSPTYLILLGGAHDDCVFRCTFIHYAEEKVGVAYRYKKKIFNPENINDYVIQFVRYLDEEEYIEQEGRRAPSFCVQITSDYTKLGEDLIKENIIAIKPFGYSKTRMVKLDLFCDFLAEKIKNTPNYVIKTK